MFHSIKIPYEDQMTHLYFWRNCNEELPPEKSLFAITAVNMGDRPSACIAQVCLRKSAERYQQEHPEAAKIIIRNAYMDDIASSSTSKDEAESNMKEMDTILESNGFRIKEWIKTGEERREPKKNEVQTKVRVLAGVEEGMVGGVESVLGMQWDPKEDTIGYHFKVCSETKITKR